MQSLNGYTGDSSASGNIGLKKGPLNADDLMLLIPSSELDDIDEVICALKAQNIPLDEEAE